MIHLPAGSIVVGIDGSPSSDAALLWAVDEAVRRHKPLHLLHARDDQGWWTRGGAYQPAEVAGRHDTVLGGRMLLAQERGPDLDVTCEAVGGVAAAALVERSGRAELIVVGGRGGDSLRGILLGSVSRQVAAHAACPVVVVHDESYRSREGASVLVGVDGSPGSTMALEFGFARAADRAAALTAVHASWSGRDGEVSPLGTESPADDGVRAEQQLVSDAVAALRDKYPDVPVRERVVRARPVDALVAGSAAAQLLVVGTRGAGGFRGLVLGSVSHRLLQRAHCPVAVVHPPQEG